jgi:hypothetical protein
MKSQLRCHGCGETIGVYEPVVRLTRGLAVLSSLAREPGLVSTADPCYHRRCTTLDVDDLGAEESGAELDTAAAEQAAALRRLP